MINKNSKVFDVIKDYPAAFDFFISKGFTDLKNPLMRNTIARTATIEIACKNHRIDCAKFILELKTFLKEKINF